MQEGAAEKFHFEPPFTSFDHPIGNREQAGLERDTERLGGAEIDDKFKLGRLNARYCDDCGSGIDSRSGRSASAQPSVPSGYQMTLAYPMPMIRFAAFHDIQQSRRQ